MTLEPRSAELDQDLILELVVIFCPLSAVPGSGRGTARGESRNRCGELEEQVVIAEEIQ